MNCLISNFRHVRLSHAFRKLNLSKRHYCIISGPVKELRDLLANPRPGSYHIWNYSPRIFKKDSTLQLEEYDFERNYINVMLGSKCMSDFCRCKKDLIINLLQGLLRLKRKKGLRYTTAMNLNILINYAEKEYNE